jgi:hypothetical protein
MAVKSTTFGRVTLTGEDAKKFERQVAYGKPKAAAKESVSRGVVLAERFRGNDRTLTFKVPIRPR